MNTLSSSYCDTDTSALSILLWTGYGLFTLPKLIPLDSCYGIVHDAKCNTYQQSEDLNSLRRCICQMTSKEQHVAWLDAQCKPHKHTTVISLAHFAARDNQRFFDIRVQAQGGRHTPRNHTFILLQISNGCQRQAPIRHGTPKMR